MLYNLKKAYFVLSAISVIPFLLFWILFYLYHHLDFIYPIIKDLGLRMVFEGDSIIGYVLITMIHLPLNAIIYLIFYRREVIIWPKLMLLFSGLICFTSGAIKDYVFRANFYKTSSPLGGYLLLGVYAAIALAAIVWLIAAMVKYPKAEPNAA